MSDGKYALTPSEAALTTTRGGNPLFDHPTLWLGGLSLPNLIQIMASSGKCRLKMGERGTDAIAVDSDPTRPLARPSDSSDFRA